MKKIKILLTVLLSLVIFTSCGNTSEDVEKKYSITFEENGGTEVSDIYDIKKGGTVSLPSVVRTGYTFEGWYTSKKFISGTEITDSTPIGKDIKVYAKWKALTFGVNISLDGGSMDSKYLDGHNNINYGVEVNLPTPKKSGYLFQGWFLDGTPFDGNFIVDKNVNITTKWIDLSTLDATYSLSLNLDGGSLYKYNTKEELMEEFFADFSKFIKTKVDSTNFWNHSYNSIIGEHGFFGNKEYFNKWSFFIEYLSTTAREENRIHITKLLNGENLDYSQREMTRTVIRNEILAFFLNTERVVPGWGSLISANYANEELQNGYLEYCKIDAPAEYVTGEGISLKEPIKEGYVFLGWYSNSDFTGDIYTEVGMNEYGERTFYALWGRVE